MVCILELSLEELRVSTNHSPLAGFPVCGCCDDSTTLFCSACGGDAGGGICKGAGLTGVGYQGCSCITNGGAIPDIGSEYRVCPEDTGLDPQACSAASCGGDTLWKGICDLKTVIGGAFYTFCSCCPADAIACVDCGGNQGNSTCRGIEQYSGIQYRNCECNSDGSSKTPVLVPFPIPPPGYPIPPPGTPNPEQTCSDTIDVKCSDCLGTDGWCQDGEHVGCPCEDEQQQCPEGDDVPDCSASNCGGAQNSSKVSACLGV